LSKRTLLSFSLAAVVAVVFTVCDYLLLDDIIPNLGPQLTAYDLIKTVVALCLAAAIVAGILHDGRGVHRADPPIVTGPGLVIFNLALAAAFVLLFLVSPTGFNWLGSEDNIVEYLSAIFGIVGAVFFAGVALAAHHLPDGSPNRRLTLTFAALCAVVLFLLGMEEISWGQRLFGFGTPESFAANRQGEVNLHNFFTTPVHTIYRLGSWAVLILLPFMVTFGPRLRLFDAFHNFLPPPWIAAMSAPVACFNYNAWPFLPTQVVVFSSLLMMAVFWRQATRDRQGRTALAFLSATLLIIVAQAAFLIGGDRFIRHWDVTEYQECFMAFGLAAVGWAAWARVREHSQQAEVRLATKGR
jgi:hypothetical protein